MIRVLVVDDQELVRDGLAMIVDAQPDMEVCGQAGDGNGIVTLVRETRPDVVLMDIRMPDIDGITATRQLRAAAFDRLAILVLTTFDLDEYVYEALKAGATGFLLKDTPRAKLLDGIRTVSTGESLLAPAVTRRLIESYVAAAQPSSQPDLGGLSAREQDVLQQLVLGRSNAEIGAALYLGEATVKTHITAILRTIGVRDRVQAVIWAYENGFVQPGAKA